MNHGSYDIVLLLLAFFFPPLGLLFKVGLHNELVICALLTLLGYFPGVIYAWWIIIRRPGAPYYYIPRIGNDVPVPAPAPVQNPEDPQNLSQTVPSTAEPIDIPQGPPEQYSEQMASSLPQNESTSTGMHVLPKSSTYDDRYTVTNKL